MDDNVYFDGDPATESTRRQLEQLMKETRPRRRWPWMVGAVAAAAAWYFWPRGPAAETPKKPTP